MKALLVLLILAALVATIYLVLTWVRQRAEHRKIDGAKWDVDERTSDDGTHYTLFCIKPGEHDQQVGAPIYLGQQPWNFQEELTQRRIEAQDRADALNRKDNT